MFFETIFIFVVVYTFVLVINAHFLSCRGIVVGRQIVNVRICSCPGRDKKQEEKKEEERKQKKHIENEVSIKNENNERTVDASVNERPPPQKRRKVLCTKETSYPTLPVSSIC